MKKLMKSATLLASVGAMLCFAGCNSVGDKPEEIVLELLKKTQSGKIDQEFLNKYCEEDTVKLFSGNKMTGALKGAKFIVSNVFVDDDIAVVKIWQDGGNLAGFSYYDAKKVDGQWKIQFNKKGGDDDWCVSQKTIPECVEAFKAAISRSADQKKYEERSTLNFWCELQVAASEMSLDALEELKTALKNLKIKEHKRRYDNIEVGLEMPWKNGNIKSGLLTIKVEDGKWKIAEFLQLDNFLGIK